MAESDRVEVVCPCCRTRLTVEKESGEVLAEQRPKLDATKTFEDAMNKVRGGAREREDLFAKAFDRTQRQDDLLNKKFEEAKKKAKDEPGKPHNPFDMD